MGDPSLGSRCTNPSTLSMDLVIVGVGCIPEKSASVGRCCRRGMCRVATLLGQIPAEVPLSLACAEGSNAKHARSTPPPRLALNPYDISPQARKGLLQDCTVRFRRMGTGKVRNRLGGKKWG